MSLMWPPKDKDETLDFSVDWSRYLGDMTISSVSWYVDVDGTKTSITTGETVNGIECTQKTNTTTVATIYLNQGTNNFQYKFWCSITTDTGLVAERVVKLKIREYT